MKRHYNKGKDNPMYGTHRTGVNAPGYGIRHTEEAKQRIGVAHSEERMWNWKGDNVSYKGLHKWLNSRIPKPDLCQHCKQKPPHHLANINGIYNRDFNNYRYLCGRCHRVYDVFMRWNNR